MTAAKHSLWPADCVPAIHLKCERHEIEWTDWRSVGGLRTRINWDEGDSMNNEQVTGNPTSLGSTDKPGWYDVDGDVKTIMLANSRVYRIGEPVEPKATPPSQVPRNAPKFRRNGACPCGSGAKFKACCINWEGW